MKLTAEYEEAVNAIVPHSTPIGAYCVGVVSAMLTQTAGVFPTKAMLQEAAMCQSIPDAEKLAESFIRKIKARRSRRYLSPK